MENLSFDRGLKEYEINGKVKVRFNPADVSFAKSLHQAFDKLDALQEKYAKEFKAAENDNAVFDIVEKQEKEMRAVIDGVFQTDVCDGVFGGMSLIALADGFPVWVNFMLAILDEMDAAIIREKKATDPRILKYTKKYKK